MKFKTKAEALYYKNRHSEEFRQKLIVVKCRYWSMDDWAFRPCWTVIMK